MSIATVPGHAVTSVKIGDVTDRGEVAAVRTTEYTDHITIEVRLRMPDYPSHILSDWIQMRMLNLHIS